MNRQGKMTFPTVDNSRGGSLSDLKQRGDGIFSPLSGKWLGGKHAEVVVIRIEVSPCAANGAKGHTKIVKSNLALKTNKLDLFKLHCKGQGDSKMTQHPLLTKGHFESQSMRLFLILLLLFVFLCRYVVFVSHKGAATWFECFIMFSQQVVFRDDTQHGQFDDSFEQSS